MSATSPLRGFQRWRSLLFVHWAVSLESVRRLVPSSLEIDTFGDPPSAYVGLVAFDIPELRVVRGIPARLHFLETNLRTYVTCGGVPGVWFFSLDAASSIAVAGARAAYGLPYFRADMRSTRAGDRFSYSSERRWPRPLAAFDLSYEVGEPVTQPSPGSLEYFLVERYVLFAQHPLLGLVQGEVRHTPYPLRHARVDRLDESLRSAAGFPPDGRRTADYWSEGVDVEILPPRRLRRTN